MITLTTGTKSGFLGPDDKPLTDASGVKASDFVNEDALDFISIMSYDVGGFFSKNTGINQPWEAPKDQCSMKRSLDYWTNEAKVPANKVQVGLPAYGKLMIINSEKGAKLSDDGPVHDQLQPQEIDRTIIDRTSNQNKYEYLLANPFSQEAEWNVDRTCGGVTQARISPTVSFASITDEEYNQLNRNTALSNRDSTVK